LPRGVSKAIYPKWASTEDRRCRPTPIEDFLIPGEEIKFQSSSLSVHYAGKPYALLVTNKRLLLYARRGLVFKNYDVVSQKLDELLGVKYRETGTLMKTGILDVQGKTLIQLTGSCAQMKALYQQLMQFI